MKDNMFYKASPLILKKAEELRNNPTEAENLLWNYLRQNNLGVKFRRQHPAHIYVLDFYAHQIKLAIEIDGTIHDLEDVKKNNFERQTYLKSLGITVLRFSNVDVFENIELIVQRIQETIKILREPKELQEVSKLTFRGRGTFIIPAIDIIEGKCVRLIQGDYEQKKIYNEHPLEVAKQFEDVGLKRLHLVDLDGARQGAVKNWKVLEAIAGRTSLIIDFGGGIKKSKDVEIVFECGAAYATVGSIAVKDETTFLQWVGRFGAEKFLLGADVKEEKIIFINGPATTEIFIYDFI